MTKAKERRNDTSNALPDETLRYLDLDLIDIGDQLLRDDPDDDSIIELASSIQRDGLHQPIGVRPAANGRFELLWGCRRLHAHRRLRYHTILARVRDVSDEQVKAVAIVENIQRLDMTLTEECRAVHHLHHQSQLSPEQIAAVIGKSRAWVMQRLAIPNLPPDVREPLLSGSISLGIAEAVSLLAEEGARAFILSQAQASKLTIPQVRAMVRTYQETPDIQAAVAAGVAAAQSGVTPQPILMQCAACGIAKPLDQLTLIRVCANSCATDDDAQKEKPVAH